MNDPLRHTGLWFVSEEISCARDPLPMCLEGWAARGSTAVRGQTVETVETVETVGRKAVRRKGAGGRITSGWAVGQPETSKSSRGSQLRLLGTVSQVPRALSPEESRFGSAPGE